MKTHTCYLTADKRLKTTPSNVLLTRNSYHLTTAGRTKKKVHSIQTPTSVHKHAAKNCWP